MKRKNLLLILMASALSMGAVPNLFKKNASIDVGDDPISYGKASEAVADFASPHFRKVTRAESGDDDDDEAIGPVNTIKIHYVNSDKKDCKSRAFYIWANNGQKGVEYSDSELSGAGDIVEYAADGSSMTITINIGKDNLDPRFKGFEEGLSSIFYIVKYKMNSKTDENWGGQSDDVELVFAEFPPVNGLIEVYATPAAGGGMAQFATEEETKVDGVKLARFTDWKTIRCTATDESKTLKWDLYAFDSTYYKVKLKKRSAIEKNYLVMSGTNSVIGSSKEFNIEFPYTAKINMVYMLVSKEVSSTSPLAKTVYVSYSELYDTPKFEKYYCYDGNDLGMTYTKDFTTFKVWAPIAANMSILIYDKGNDSPILYGGKSNKPEMGGWYMTYTTGGVWQITLMGDLKGYYYEFQVDNYNGTTTTVDPYVTAVGCSSARGMVYDKNEVYDGTEEHEYGVNPTNWNDLPAVWDGNNTFKWSDHGVTVAGEKTGLNIDTPQELTVYEVHVRDFTEDSSWVSNNGIKGGTYKAFVEKGTHLDGHNDVSTGFDHLNELGVSAVQLMPVFDSDNDESGIDRKATDPATAPLIRPEYNWGYNPQNYNAVEGAYSSDPHNATTRIREFKELILGMSQTKEHTRVIMDVVYNHVSSVSASSFNKLMPRYYFRYTKDGELHNGSGCHNEVKSEAKMMRKFIVDSVCMWAKEYKIKGFRFDLMGLIDYKTMNELKDALSAIDPDIYVYGEGWTAEQYNGSSYETYGTYTWHVYNFCNNFDPNTGIDDNSRCYLGGFNNTGRNAVKGDNGSPYPERGMLQKVNNQMWDEPNKVADMLWGIHRDVSNYAKQTVNYVSCHDNWTVVDQLYQTARDDGNYADTGTIIRGSFAAHALVFASNGVAFMLGGEEIFRTKEIKPEVLNDEIPASSYAQLYNRLVSHNSYNSPIEVNSFKWGNKISVKIDENDAECTDAAMQYNAAWRTLVSLHKRVKEVRFTSPTSKGDIWPNGVTKSGFGYENLTWPGAAESSSRGFQYDDVFVYVCGKSSENSNMGFEFTGGYKMETLFRYGDGDGCYDGSAGSSGTITFNGGGYGVFVGRRVN